MHILFATAEMSPTVRVGGLAEAAAGLVRALRGAGHRVTVALPHHGSVTLDEPGEPLDTPPWAEPTQVRLGHHDTLGELALVDADSIRRPHPYADDNGDGWWDNDRRFMTFSAAVAALARRFEPDVVHLNDWHTAAATAWLDSTLPTVLTIHTLGYQGVCGPEWIERLGPHGPLFEWYGGTNPLAGALEIADRVIAVSPTYAAEIVRPEGGMGLDARLRRLGDRLVGIRNGIDTSVWNPADDERIAAHYSASDHTGRAECRRALLEGLGWPDDRRLLVGMVTRLVEQKGVDLLLGAVPYLRGIGVRVVVLGAGQAHLAAELRRAADEHPDEVAFTEGYDDALGHRIFAGVDMFAMPSRFEPCGLAQMQAMAYGAIPVVTDVGGLHDTVIDVDHNPSAGTGIVSRDVSVTGIVDALHRGGRACRLARRLTAMRTRGMSEDWSWSAPADAHLALYLELVTEAS